MTAGMWPRLRSWPEEVWGRHVRHRELYRLLDQMRADYRARTAWVDALTEEDGAAFLRRLAERGGDVQALPIHRKTSIEKGEAMPITVEGRRPAGLALDAPELRLPLSTDGAASTPELSDSE